MLNNYYLNISFVKQGFCRLDQKGLLLYNTTTLRIAKAQIDRLFLRTAQAWVEYKFCSANREGILLDQNITELHKSQ